MASQTVNITRAPVLTLWATVVAERLGSGPEVARTFGKVVAGLNAQSTGRQLGMFEESTDAQADKDHKARQSGETSTVTLLHRRVPVMRTEPGVQATVKDRSLKRLRIWWSRVPPAYHRKLIDTDAYGVYAAFFCPWPHHPSPKGSGRTRVAREAEQQGEGPPGRPSAENRVHAR